MLTYAISFLIITLIASVWSRIKYTDARIQPNYDEYHIIPRGTLNIISTIMFLMFLVSIILVLIAVNNYSNFYNYQ